MTIIYHSLSNALIKREKIHTHIQRKRERWQKVQCEKDERMRTRINIRMGKRM